MKSEIKQSQDDEVDESTILEKEYLEVSKKLALARKQFDILEKRHWNVRRKFERAKGFLWRNEYDTIEVEGKELILLYYRGELVIKNDLDELVEYYFRNMYTRVCPEEV